MTSPNDSKKAELRRAALEYHEFPTPGKIAIAATKQLVNQHDLALAYSPGVAAPCEEIVKDPNNAFKYTSPKFGPLTVDLMRAYGETNVGNTSGTAQTGDFKSWGVNYSAGPLQAKLVWDSITNTELKYALPGEINAGVLSYSSTATSNVTTQYKTKPAGKKKNITENTRGIYIITFA